MRNHIKFKFSIEEKFDPNITSGVLMEHSRLKLKQWMRNLIFDETTNHFNKFMSAQKLMKLQNNGSLSNIFLNVSYKLQHIP